MGATIRWYVSALGMLILASCGSADNTSSTYEAEIELLSHEAIAEGWDATSDILRVGPTSSQYSLQSGSDTGAATGTYACPNGGTASFTREHVGAFESSQFSASFSYAVSFEACQHQGVQIDGSLSYQGEAHSADGTAAFQATHTGEVVWSGDVSGSCLVDLTTTSTVTYSSTNFSAAMEAQGTVCGEDAEAVFDIELP